MFSKVLVLAPHTDDGELGCGGMISKLVENGIDVFAHPTLYAVRNRIYLNEGDFHTIANLCLNHDVLIEKNMKYNLLGIKFKRVGLNLNCKFVQGSDAHKISELLNLSTNYGV